MIKRVTERPESIQNTMLLAEFLSLPSVQRGGEAMLLNIFMATGAREEYVDIVLQSPLAKNLPVITAYGLDRVWPALSIFKNYPKITQFYFSKLKLNSEHTGNLFLKFITEKIVTEPALIGMFLSTPEVRDRPKFESYLKSDVLDAIDMLRSKGHNDLAEYL